MLTLAAACAPADEEPGTAGSTRTGDRQAEASFGSEHPALLEFLNAPGFRWESLDGRRIRLHFQAGGYGALLAPDFQDGAEDILDELLELLGEDRVERGVHVLLVDSRERMEELASRRDPAWWSRELNAVFLVFNQTERPLLRRTLAPLVATGLWGDADPWLAAGFGLWFDGACGEVERPLETLPALLDAAGRRVDARSLVERWDEAERTDPLAAELSAAGLLHFLVEAHGMEGLRALWQEGSGAVLRVTGQDLDALDGAWRAALPPVPGTAADLALVDAEGACR